jgi:hypothetical protein
MRCTEGRHAVRLILRVHEKTGARSGRGQYPLVLIYRHLQVLLFIPTRKSRKNKILAVQPPPTPPNAQVLGSHSIVQLLAFPEH